ncbi:hypothetical protein XH80_02295 [Bradyrhizobium sp. CCBAU 45384]|nr:hypothetical protein [Bradyrhizobium sp. CCBAU 45384]
MRGELGFFAETIVLSLQLVRPRFGLFVIWERTRLTRSSQYFASSRLNRHLILVDTGVARAERAKSASRKDAVLWQGNFLAAVFAIGLGKLHED